MNYILTIFADDTKIGRCQQYGLSVVQNINKLNTRPVNSDCVHCCNDKSSPNQFLINCSQLCDTFFFVFKKKTALLEMVRSWSLSVHSI